MDNTFNQKEAFISSEHVKKVMDLAKEFLDSKITCENVNLSHIIHDHSLAVARIASRLMSKLMPTSNNINKCILAAVLHDLGKLTCEDDKANHAIYSHAIAKELLKRSGVPEEHHSDILNAIYRHSDKELDKISTFTIYDIVLIEADIISKLDITEIMLRYDKSLSIADNVNNLYTRRGKKVDAYRSCITTEPGIQLYRQYHKQNENMLDQMLYGEVIS